MGEQFHREAASMLYEHKVIFEKLLQGTGIVPDTKHTGMAIRSCSFLTARRSTRT